MATIEQILSRPRNPDHVSNVAVRILDGDVRVFNIPGHGVVPSEIRGASGEPGDDGRLRRGYEDAAFWASSLPRVVEISARTTPGVVWWCAPDFDSHAGHTEFAFKKKAAVLMSMRRHPRFTIGTAYHEAGHMAEGLVYPHELQHWWNAANSTKAWGDDYLDSQDERRAQLFESFAIHGADGGEHVILPGATPTTRLMNAIYTGEIGRRRQGIHLPSPISLHEVSMPKSNVVPMSRFQRWLRAA
jgi:hypothetical protein